MSLSKWLPCDFEQCHPLLWGGGILVDHWSTISSFSYSIERYIDSLVKYCNNSRTLAIELLQSCTMPSMLNIVKATHLWHQNWILHTSRNRRYHWSRYSWCFEISRQLNLRDGSLNPEQTNRHQITHAPGNWDLGFTICVTNRVYIGSWRNPHHFMIMLHLNQTVPSTDGNTEHITNIPCEHLE